MVKATQLNAINMFVPLLDRFPIIEQVNDEQMDFVLIVASVFIAVTRLTKLNIGKEREEKLIEIVASQLEQWNHDGINGYKDSIDLFEREFDRLTTAGHEHRFVSADAVGIWIVLNILGRLPETEEEIGLVRATGVMVTSTFFDWWDNKK